METVGISYYFVDAATGSVDLINIVCGTVLRPKKKKNPKSIERLCCHNFKSLISCFASALFFFYLESFLIFMVRIKEQYVDSIYIY